MRGHTSLAEALRAVLPLGCAPGVPEPTLTPRRAANGLLGPSPGHSAWALWSAWARAP